MTRPDRCFVALDWSQLESWLSAYLYHDDLMMAELKAQGHGGFKVHALNAALIYGIDPTDAKSHMVNFGGQQRSAYDAGKRCSHAFNYGMEAEHMAEVFWLSRAFAAEIIAKLCDKYKQLIAGRTAVVDKVFGRYRFHCAACRRDVFEPQACPTCHGKMELAETIVSKSQYLTTPFQRRRVYLGSRLRGKNAVIAQLPQSCGASMWWRTLLRFHGYNFYQPDIAWPTLEGMPVWSPRVQAYGELYAPFEVFVSTGTYDSFVFESPTARAGEVAAYMRKTATVSWPELGGLSIPCEVSIGYNLGKFSDTNPNGLKEVT